MADIEDMELRWKGKKLAKRLRNELLPGSSISYSREKANAYLEGVDLGKWLRNEVPLPPECMRRGSDDPWKVLALLWVQTLLYAAPYGDVQMHVQHLSQGGEYITHLWALLYHLGIDKWEQEPAGDDEWEQEPARRRRVRPSRRAKKAYAAEAAGEATAGDDELEWEHAQRDIVIEKLQEALRQRDGYIRVQNEYNMQQQEYFANYNALQRSTTELDS
ncbi:hypothetical protein BAE44_0008058, partial [Dichanthelium oligosanthes]